VRVLDVTSDFGIPVMTALPRRTGGPGEQIMLGFGAHPDPHLALRRALTELNLLMPTVLAGAERGDYGPDPTAADIEAVRARLEEQGLELLVLDQTRPDIGLPVVKVIVPGLRGFWVRFAPGRLYDVPVELGRRKARAAYSELNPISLFL
jgi:oxazoline/thiazoline synthase